MLRPSCLAVCFQNSLEAKLYFTAIMNKGSIIGQSFRVRWIQHFEHFQDACIKKPPFALPDFVYKFHIWKWLIFTARAERWSVLLGNHVLKGRKIMHGLEDLVM